MRRSKYMVSCLTFPYEVAQQSPSHRRYLAMVRCLHRTCSSEAVWPTGRATPPMNEADTGANVTDRLNDLLLAVGRDRDRTAFQALFTHFAPRLRVFMNGRRTDPNLAEEIVQETMVNVWRKARQFEPAKASAATWIYTIARNVRIDMLRKISRPEPDFNDPAFVPEVDPPAPELISQKQQAARLREVFASLPDEQRKVLRLAFMEEKTHNQISVELGIPLGTVKSRIRLALKRVRSEVGERE